MIYTGTMIVSMALYAVMPTVTVYIAEIAHPSIRGSLVTLPTLMLAFGTLIIWVESFTLSWRYTACLAAIGEHP